MTQTGTGKYEQLLERCRPLDPVPTAVAHPCEETALAGAMDAGELGLIIPILVGPIAKIREVDALARRFPQRLVEVHPECAFARLAGAPLPPKAQVNGREQRLHVLTAAFGHIDVRQRGAAPHDVLDAYAVLWSTLRYSSGDHVEFGDGSHDEFGLPMRIVS